MDATLRLHQFLPSSHTNGPGLRAVLWVQGCSLGCPRCFNPATHSARARSFLLMSCSLALSRWAILFRE
jgi:pyruvate-formate lyase-activating enzyme